MTGDLRREHWIVPVHGMTPTDPDGTVQATAHRDGTVVLHLTCGDCQAKVRLDVCRAAQLSTGIWEATSAAQRLTGYLGDDQPPPSPPPNRSGDLPEACRAHHRSAPPRDRSPKPRRRPPSRNTGAAMDPTRAIGLRIRRIREARDKSLRIISGLAGMSSSTLHRIEHGQREQTLSEIVALANALEIAPAKLTTSTFLASTCTRR